MNLHILPKEQTAGETMGKAFKNNFQQSFGSGMQALANMKMQDYAARQAQAREQQFAEELSKRLEPQFGKNVSQVPFMSKQMQGPALQHMFAEMEKQQRIGKASQFWKGVGFSDDMAMALAAQEPGVQKSFLDRIEGMNIPMNQQGQAPGEQGEITPGQYTTPGQQGQKQGLTLGANPTERRFREQLGQKKYEFETTEKRQEREYITEQNKPTSSYLETHVPYADEGLKDVRRMKELLATGKVFHDTSETYMNTIHPARINPETKEFMSLAKTVVSNSTQLAKGIPTGFKIRWEEGQKPNVQQDPQTQMNLLDQYEDKFSKILLSNNIREDLIAKNNGDQPKNMGDEISKRINYIESKGIPFNDVLGQYKQSKAEEYERSLQEQNQNAAPTQIASQEQQQPPQQGPEVPPEQEKVVPQATAGEIVPVQQPDQKQLSTHMQQTLDYLEKNPLKDILTGVTEGGKEGIRQFVGLTSDTILDTLLYPFDFWGMGINALNFVSGGKTPSTEEIPYYPTSGKGKKLVSEKTGGYTENTGGLTGKVRDAIETGLNFILPGKTTQQGIVTASKFISPDKAVKAAKWIMPFSGTPMSIAKAALTAGGGELASEGVKFAGGGPALQTAAKMTAYMAMGMYGTKQKAYETMQENYQKTHEAITSLMEGETIHNPQGTMIDIKPIEDALTHELNEVNKGASPYKDQMIALIKQFQDAMGEVKKQAGETITKQAGNVKAGVKSVTGAIEGLVPAADILTLKRNTNQWILLNKIPLFEKQPYLPKEARYLVERINGLFKAPLDQVAKTNTKFGTYWALAEDAYRGFADLGQGARWLKDNVNMANGFKSAITGSLLFGGAVGGGIGGIAGAGAGILAGGLGAFGLREGAILARLLRSKTGQEAYIRAMKAASMESPRAFVREANKIDKMIVHEETKLRKKEVTDKKVLSSLVSNIRK